MKPEKAKQVESIQTKPHIWCTEDVITKAPKQSTRSMTEIHMESMID